MNLKEYADDMNIKKDNLKKICDKLDIIYDNDDYIQEGSILIWKKIRDRKWNPGSGRFGNFFYTAFRFRVLHMYRTYVMKNMIKINESEDYYYYGYRICTLVVDEFAIEYREKQKERNKAWAINQDVKNPNWKNPKNRR